MSSETESWQHRYIMTNGIRMHYVKQGEGPLIVLLHGFPEFWYSWRHQIPFLAEHGRAGTRHSPYMVVAPDLRGYNDTDKPRTGYDVPTLIRDIEGLVKELGQERAIIVGHDWGGVLAWSFAIRYPQMTERLIVMNAPHPAAMMRELRTWKQLRKSWYIFFFQIPWLPEHILLRNSANEVGRMLRGAAVQKSAFPREVTAKFQQAMSKPGAMTAALNYYRQLFRHLPTPTINRRATEGKYRVSAPTLLIWGEQDIALDIALTTGLEQWVDNIEVKRIPDSGHWVQQEQPDKVNAYMLQFLQGTQSL
jgi:pimeloyl-ACP methyl ester carboxylesterase